MKKLFWYLKTVLNKLIYVIVSLLPQKDIMKMVRGTKITNKDTLRLQKKLNRQGFRDAVFINGVKSETNSLKTNIFSERQNTANKIFQQKPVSVYGNKRIRSERAPCRNWDFPFLYINFVCFT